MTASTILFEEPPTDLAALTPRLENAAISADPLFFAVVDLETGRAVGRQSLTRIEAAHGVIETGIPRGAGDRARPGRHRSIIPVRPLRLRHA